MTDWDAGGWPGARRAQEDAFLALTPEQRLAWLEEAIAFARIAMAAPGGADASPPSSG